MVPSCPAFNASILMRAASISSRGANVVAASAVRRSRSASATAVSLRIVIRSARATSASCRRLLSMVRSRPNPISIIASIRDRLNFLSASTARATKASKSSVEAIGRIGATGSLLTGVNWPCARSTSRIASEGYLSLLPAQAESNIAVVAAVKSEV